MEAKRSELIFMYDLTWSNPNGDPMDENKPRIDAETGINFVTDVRIKRTIRDEFINTGFSDKVLIKDTLVETEKGTALADAKHRALDFAPDGITKSSETLTREQEDMWKNNILSCIDTRLFGCTLPYELKKIKGSITYTGPVQFKMGYSMHPVKSEFIKGTGAFASSDNKQQKTFRQEYVLPYSLIMSYALINDRASKLTTLTEDDVNLMLDALWNGTKNLISRTKAGQTPRLLVRVVYKDNNFHIGELDKFIKFEYEGSGEKIRDINDGRIVFDNFINKLRENSDSIEKVVFQADQRSGIGEILDAMLIEAGIDVVKR
jgi:CRISPR-associated protein Csh2